MPHLSDYPKGWGRSTYRFKQLAKKVRSWKNPCCICGQPIDYGIAFDHKAIDPGVFTVQHKLSLHSHPQHGEDIGNLDAAHHRCNSAEAGRVQLSLGLLSEDW